MKPGREMDARIAIEIMGEPRPTANLSWEQHFTGDSASEGGNWLARTTGYDSGDEAEWVPKPYSTDIAAAWEVVEKVGGNAVIYYMPGGSRFDPDVPGVFGVGLSAYEDGPGLDFDVELSWGETLPHAIASAALRAVGALEGE